MVRDFEITYCLKTPLAQNSGHVTEQEGGKTWCEQCKWHEILRNTPPSHNSGHVTEQEGGKTWCEQRKWYEILR